MKYIAEMEKINQNNDEMKENKQDKNETISYLKTQIFDLEEENEEI